jgi:hypothetical protein
MRHFFEDRSRCRPAGSPLGEPTAAFARADIDGSGDLTFDEWHLAFGGEEGVEADVLRALFDEFDADQNGCVSLAEFQAGLKTVRQLATGLDEMKGLVRGIRLEDLFASHLALMLQERRPADEKELPIDLAETRRHAGRVAEGPRRRGRTGIREAASPPPAGGRHHGRGADECQVCRLNV